MVIAHNLIAMFSERYNKINQSNLGRSTEKLSSGYKINRGADNAAGLSISEKMRGQIRGLEKAADNAQDGISLIQTAEGAMNESHEILQRIREISVQAANDTNTEQDRSYLQDEIDMLTEELDRIANDTEYNHIKLLNGSLYSKVNSESMNKILENLYGTWINDAIDQIAQETGLNLKADSNLQVLFQDLGSSTVAAMGSSVAVGGSSNFTLYLNTRFLTDDITYGPSGPMAGGMLLDRVLTHEFTHALMRQYAETMTDIPLWFSEGLAEAVHGASDIRFWDSTTPGAVVYSQTEAEKLIQGFDFLGDEKGYNAYPAGYLAVSYLYNLKDDNGATFKQMLSDMSGYHSFDDLIWDNYGMSYTQLITGMKDAAAGDISNFIENKCKIDFGDGLGDALSEDAPGEAMISQSGTEKPVDFTDYQDELTINSNMLTIHWPDISTAVPFRLQIGANSNQSLTLSIGSLTSQSLFGTTGISIMTHSAATNAISTVDKAINYVAGERASLGAVQNRLEHAINNLLNTSENLEKAESSIRDADIAKETFFYAKNSILMQASQAILAQAVKQPQFILSLLQS
jgi:flagellin